MALRTASTQAAGASRPRSRRVSAAAASAKPLAPPRACRRGRGPAAAAGARRRPGGQRRSPPSVRSPSTISSTMPSASASRGADRVAGDDHPQRLFRADQARQALGPAGAGQQAELDLGQADPRRRRGDPEMAGERHLEAAAQRRAVQRRDDRLRHRLDLGDDLAEARGLRRLAEFGDVGAGEKGAPGAGDDDRLDGRVVARPGAAPCASPARTSCFSALTGGLSTMTIAIRPSRRRSTLALILPMPAPVLALSDEIRPNPRRSMKGRGESARLGRALQPKAPDQIARQSRAGRRRA